MDLLVEIVNLLGPPSLTDLKNMGVGQCGEGRDDGEFSGNNCSFLIDLVLSIRTFKTYEERLTDRLKHALFGQSGNIPQAIYDIIINVLQYRSTDRIYSSSKLPKSCSE